jgi:hypothetical protein
MKNFSVLIAIAFSILFFACEDEAIPVPLPPPSQTIVNEPAPTEEKVELQVTEEKPSEPVKTAKVPDKEPVKAPTKTVVYYGGDDMEQLSKGRYIIQVAIFPAEASAKRLIKKLADNGIKAYNAKVQNPDPDKGMIGTYNRVRIGFFDGKTAAEAFAKARLEPIGYAWWIDKSKNDNIGKLATYEPEEPFVVERIPEQAAKQMSEQEKREAAIAAAKEEYKAIAKAANAAASIPPPTVPAKAPKTPPPPAAKAPAPKLAPPPASKAAPPPASKTPAPVAKTKKAAKKEAEIDSRGRVKMKSKR